MLNTGTELRQGISTMNLKEEGLMNRRMSSVLAVLTVCFFIAGGTLLSAQTKIGIHRGVSVPDIRASDDNIFSRDFTSRQGPFVGAFIEIGLGADFSLVAEVNYTSQGGKRKGLQPITMELPPELPVPPDTLLFAEFNNETILEYLEIPIMVRWGFGKTTRFFINAGPYLGYLARARALTDGTSIVYLDEDGTIPVLVPPENEPLTIPLDAETDVEDSLKKTNVGLAAGGGAVFPLKPGNIIIEAHFQLGMSVLQKDVPTNGSTKTGAIVVSVGYAFTLPR